MPMIRIGRPGTPILGYEIERKELFVILGIFALAMFLRIAYFADYKNTAVFPILPYSDGDFYYQRAQEILSGDFLGGKAFLKWPLYAYFLSFLFKISASSLFFVYTVQFIIGALTCLLVYFIARLLFNSVTGFIAALMYAFYGLFVFYEGLAVYTSLSLFLNALLFLAIMDIHENPGNEKSFWSGIYLGICTITQGNIVLFGIAGILWALWHKGVSFTKYAYHVCAFIIGLSAVLGLLFLRSYIIDKTPAILTGNSGLNFYLGNNPQASGLLNWPKELSATADGMLRDARVIAKLTLKKEVTPNEASAFWMNKALEFIKNDPQAYLRLLIRKTVFLFSPQEFIFEPEYYFSAEKIRVFKFMLMDLHFILPFAFLGMLVSLKNIKRSAPLYLALATLSLGIILFFVQTKFRVTIVPYLIIFAACGFYGLGELIWKKKYAQAALLVSALCLIFAALNSKSPVKIMIGNDPNTFAAFHYHFAKAVEHENKSEYPEALAELQEAEKIRPRNHNIAYSFGAIYYYMKEFDKAEAKFKEAIEISPFFVDAHDNLGFLYNNLKRFDEAFAVLKQAEFLDPDDTGVHFE
ncbi:MAG: glycosyltransferase family 39 protein, partial [Deltaproteobacteria bacterium]